VAKGRFETSKNTWSGVRGPGMGERVGEKYYWLRPENQSALGVWGEQDDLSQRLELKWVQKNGKKCVIGRVGGLKRKPKD